MRSLRPGNIREAGVCTWNKGVAGEGSAWNQGWVLSRGIRAAEHSQEGRRKSYSMGQAAESLDCQASVPVHKA